MTKLKPLMFPIIVWAFMILILGTLITKALAADDAPALPLPPRDTERKSFPPTAEAKLVKSPVTEAANQLAADDAALANAEGEETRTAEALKGVKEAHDNAVAAVNTAKNNRLSTYNKIGHLLNPHATEKAVPAPIPPPSAPAPAPSAPPVRIEREAEAKLKTTIVVYHGSHCEPCRRLMDAILLHAAEMERYEVRYITDDTGASVPYTDVTVGGRSLRVPGWYGWDSWISSVKNCEK